MKIDRREFIKILGLSALTIPTALTIGCNKNEEDAVISFSELLDYEIIFYNANRMEVSMYVTSNDNGEYYALDLTDSQIEKYIIYDINEDKEANNNLSTYDNFINKFNVSYTESAIETLEKNIGLKEAYTAEDLQDNLYKTAKKINKQNKEKIKKLNNL